MAKMSTMRSRRSTWHSKSAAPTPGPQLFVTLSGDYDHNGTVDANDYTVWRQNYGSTSSDANGNQNGVVDAGDFLIWRHNLGRTLPGNVPAREPSSFQYQNPRPQRLLRWLCHCFTPVRDVSLARPSTWIEARGASN